MDMTRTTLLLVAASIAALVHTAWTAHETLHTRFERDVARMVFNDNLELLSRAEAEVDEVDDSLRVQLATLVDPDTLPYIVISIEDRQLWYRTPDTVLFTARVATGSGATFVTQGGRRVYRFYTPRGRLQVLRKDSMPAWVPPDWHFEEQARKRGLGLVQLTRGKTLTNSRGDQLTVVGSDVVRIDADGTRHVMAATDGREIVFDGKVVIPPFGTNQRKYKDVLGTRRLYLGDGYGLHGTNNPASIGQAVSHGCVRMRNEDIEHLYEIVPVGTPVYIY